MTLVLGIYHKPCGWGKESQILSVQHQFIRTYQWILLYGQFNGIQYSEKCYFSLFPLGCGHSADYHVSIDYFRTPMLPFSAKSLSKHEIQTKYILYSEITKFSNSDANYFHGVFYSEWQNTSICNIISCQSLHWLPSCGSSTNTFRSLCVLLH